MSSDNPEFWESIAENTTERIISNAVSKAIGYVFDHRKEIMNWIGERADEWIDNHTVTEDNNDDEYWWMRNSPML